MANKHVETFVWQLVCGAPLLQTRAQQWTEVVLRLVTQATSTVLPNVMEGDMMDIRPYVRRDHPLRR